MNRPMIVKRVLSSLVSFLLILTILLPAGLFPRAFATDPEFAGEEDLPQPSQTLPENMQQTETAAETGLPIIFENGLHYIVDPAYPNEQIILYCMNNKREWPHITPENPNVPNYTQGYLTEDQFNSPQEYQDCLRKLGKLLFAGYPYNGERLYKIVSQEELHTPTEQEFNAMLILPPQLEKAFPYLAHHQFTLDDIGNPKHMDVLTKFTGEVANLYPDGRTQNGLFYEDITAMPYYKAVNAMTFGGDTATKADALEYFAQLYSNSYFVTEKQAYDATQLAVWRLLNAYNIEHNDITSLEGSELAQVLWLYSLHGDLLTREPLESEIRVEGDLTFNYNSQDGMWHSGTLKIIEPASYNGLYELKLPEGVTAICDGLTYVYGNEPYELVSREKPTDISKFTIKTHIDWLKDMKQYSPINSDKFQNMVGAVVHKTNFRMEIPYSAEKDGSLRISKAVVGNTQDQAQSFTFILELSAKSLNGQYGDLAFQNGIARFALKHGESVKVNQLPAGITYEIKEVDAKGYQVAGSNAKGTIEAGKTIEVTFTNTKLNSLLLRKTVAGEMGDKTKKFAFSINLESSNGKPLNGSFPYVIDGKPGNGNEAGTPIQEGTLTFQNGAATVSLSHGQQIQIRDIPFGTHYRIIEEEADQDGYTTTYGGDGQGGVLDAQKAVNVINSKEYVPETGIRDAGRNGAAGMICLAVIGLAIPVLFGFVEKKRYSSR